MNFHVQLTQDVINSAIFIYGYELIVRISGYGFLITLSSVIVYWLYIKRIFVRKIPPSITTWGLWFLLDVVATAATFRQGEFNVQLITYTLGTALVCLALIMHKNLLWDKLWDTVTVAIVILSVIVYVLVDNSLWALVVALTGITIATFPMLRDLFNKEKEPWMEPWDAWLVIAMGSLLSCLDGQFLSGIWLGLLQFSILVLILYWTVKRKFIVV